MATGFALPVCEAWLLYDPLVDLAALVNSEAIERLSSSATSYVGPELAGLAEMLRADPQPAPAAKTGPIQPDFLGLVPTRACNMSCPYCDFGSSGHPRTVMDLNLVTTAVEWMANLVATSGRDLLEVHFFGGEPFVAPEVVETAVHSARAQAAKRRLSTRFEASTNGLLDERCCEFVSEYFDAVVLSFDGPRHIQDQHRPVHGGKGSFDSVARTAKKLADTKVELCLRACVTQSTVTQLEEITGWFIEQFRPSAICFEPLKPTAQSARGNFQPPTAHDFARHFWLAQEHGAAQGVRVTYAASDMAKPRLSFCPVGRDTAILTPDGRLSACYLRQQEWRDQGMELSFGKVSSGGGVELDMDALNGIRRLVETPARCGRCFARWHCAGGCHVCQSPPGCLEEYNDFCVRTRLILACQILSELGCPDKAERLLSNPRAMNRLGWHPSDRLADWRAQQ